MKNELNYTKEDKQLLKMLEILLDDFTKVTTCGAHAAPLIISYSYIEALAKLAAPNGYKSQKRFEWWVDNFLLTSNGKKYPALDLWGNRCGIVHEYSMRSDLVRSGRCNEISWLSGKRAEPLHLTLIREKSLRLLCLEKFIKDLIPAGQRMLHGMIKDKEMSLRAASRINNFFIIVDY